MKKKDLAAIYIALKKRFDGDSFKAGIKIHNVQYLCKEFTKQDLQDKINAVTAAVIAKENRANTL